MENADTYDALQSTDQGGDDAWARTLFPGLEPELENESEPDQNPLEDQRELGPPPGPDPLPTEPASKAALSPFRKTGSAPKDLSKQQLFHQLHSDPLEAPSEKQADNEDTDTLVPVQTCNTNISAMPPTPGLDDGSARIPSAPSSTKQLIIDQAVSGFSYDRPKELLELNPLPGNENSDTLMRRAENLKDAQAPQRTDLNQMMDFWPRSGPHGYMADMGQDGDEVLRGHQLPAFQQNSQPLQPTAQFATAFPTHGYQHQVSPYTPAGIPHVAHQQCHPTAQHYTNYHQTPFSPNLDPAALAQPVPAAMDNFVQASLITPPAPGQDRPAAPSFEQSTGLPSPITQASSNQSEAPSPAVKNGSREPEEEVICPMKNKNKTICGKVCRGTHAYRSMLEHIRRTHPANYINNLSANKTSFQTMVNTDGATCPIVKSDGSSCGEYFTGTRYWKTVQDHIREEHPESFVADQPASKDSFRLMVEGEEKVFCPLEAKPNPGKAAKDGPCAKVCAGAKRWRSIQEHIRRAHPDKYIPGLNATEESFRRMTAGFQAVTPGPANSREDSAAEFDGPGLVRPASSSGCGPQSQREGTSPPPAPSDLMPPQEDSALEAAHTGISQFFYNQSPVWSAAEQQTAGSVDPAAFITANISDMQHAGMLQAHMAFHRSDPTLAPSLFNSRSSPEQMLATHSVAFSADTPQQQQVQPQSYQNGTQQVEQQLMRQQTSMGQVLGNASLQVPGLSPVEKRKWDDSDDGRCKDGSDGGPCKKRYGASADAGDASTACHKRLSPYFPATASFKQADGVAAVATQNPKRKRLPRNTVSALPVPSLTANKFGLVQEKLAADPFRLLIALVFLIRTPGKTAIPVFEDVMKRWPTPWELAAADPADIKAMIYKLGLCGQRCEMIQKYARMWFTQPPTKDVRYGVKDYPRKGDGKDVASGELFGPELEARLGTSDMYESDQNGSEPIVKTKARGDGTSWEIGHLTLGKYAIDSWRIFCRDVLLGRAEDWKGKGRDPDFQPEWMRVLPDDKELRACLRWMWMKEGWWWDPNTGDKTILSEDMERAVNEGRVQYDDEGQLQITDAPVQ